jgi:hypothetical protein
MDLLQAELAERLLVPPKVFMPPNATKENCAPSLAKTGRK